MFCELVWSGAMMCVCVSGGGAIKVIFTDVANVLLSKLQWEQTEEVSLSVFVCVSVYIALFTIPSHISLVLLICKKLE